MYSQAAPVSHPVDSQGEEEDEELSRKLVTAIINAAPWMISVVSG